MSTTKKKLKMLRVGVTYPNENLPGAGLHPYYHSMYSDYDETIIIAKQSGEKPQNREGVRLIELDLNNTALGKYQENIFARLFKMIRKYHEYNLYAKRARKYIDEVKPDIVHVYSPMPIKCGMYARKKYGSCIVMSLHGSDALRMGKVTFLGKYLLSIPDAVVVVGENMIETLPSDAKLHRPIECIGNGVDLQMFTNQHKLREKQFIHVGNLRWQKGQEYLIRGFAEFHSSHPDYKLIMIGEGEEREKLQALCATLGVQDAVQFKGTQGRQYIADELNKSKAFVLTSVSEGFPKVIIEAMAAGTPVISSDVGNVKAVLQDSGFIFPAKDSVAVCEAMEKVQVSDGVWQTLSNKAETYARQYSWVGVAKKLDDIYRSCLNEKK